MKKIGIIGLGNMGLPIYNAIVKSNQYEVFAFDPNINSQDLKLNSSIESLIENSEIILLSVKPDKILSIVQKIKTPKIILSIAAGISLESIRANSHPNSKLVRLMPNLPLQIGEGCIAYFGDISVYTEVKKIFSSQGLLYELGSEELIDSFTALAGSGPAFVFSFAQALAEGGVKSGLSYADSLAIAIQTIKGSIQYLESEYKKNKTHPMELRNRVTSAGGTTIFGLSEWEKNATGYSISETVYQAKLRASELKKISE